MEKKRVAITDDSTSMRCRLLIALVKMAGGEPVLIPMMLDPNHIGLQHTQVVHRLNASIVANALNKHLLRVIQILSTCDALILPGNKNDVPPGAYGERFVHDETKRRLPKDPLDVRFATEKKMAEFALNTNPLPILAVCGGMQLLNVVLGGTLVQHLPDELSGSSIEHLDECYTRISINHKLIWESQYRNHIFHGAPKNIFPLSHPMMVREDSLLARLYLANNPNISLQAMNELSIHHQGCFEHNLAQSLRATAIAPDGVVEAIEHISHPKMFLAMQFHFECNVSEIAFSAVEKLLTADM